MPELAPSKSVKIGDMEVTYLPDGGGITNPLALYPASTEAGWQKHPESLDEEGKFITTIGAFLIRTGDRIIAVDLGMGPVDVSWPGVGRFFGGKYLESLKAAGVSPAEVTDVLFTHMHVDHVGWTSQEIDGRRQLTFPNARYWVTAEEWEFWRGGDNPAGPHPEYVQQPLSGRLEMIAAGDEVAPGITVIPTPGHTPGHISLLITAGAERLYLVADIFHGQVQLEEPGWNVAFDTDPALARQSREQLYQELIQPNTIVAANHFANNVFGRISKKGDRLTWSPL